MLFHYQWYASQTIGKIVVGNCNADKAMLDLAIIWEYVETLSNFELASYDINKVLHNDNCLTIEEMQSIVQWFNKKFNVNYVLDFINSNITYIPAGSCSCGTGTYTTTIDETNDDKIWIGGDITTEIGANNITLTSCDGLTTYLSAATPDSFGVDIYSNTYINLNVLNVPLAGWDRSVIYCLTIV